MRVGLLTSDAATAIIETSGATPLWAPRELIRLEYCGVYLFLRKRQLYWREGSVPLRFFTGNSFHLTPGLHHFCNWSLVSGNEAMIPPRHLVLLKDELRGSRSSTRYWFSIPTRMVVSSVYLAPWRIQIFFGGFWFLLQSVWVSINRNQVEELIFRSGKPNICVSLAVGSIVVNAA